MVPSEKRGWGAAQARNKPCVIVPRTCISSQLAPPVLSPKAKKMFAASEDYHAKS
jgi:hypothetical protein